MASLESRAGRYHVVFRFSGVKFSRSLQTKSEKTARAALARLDDNLRRVQLGNLVIPDGADVPAFLLSDGRLSERPQLPTTHTLRELFEAYFDAIPEDAIEATTRYGMRIHEGHLRRILGDHFAIQRVELLHLQRYIEARSRAPGRRAAKISAATIMKELRTLTTVWSWARHAGLLERPLPKRGLKFPKLTEKSPFQSFQEVQIRIQRGGLSGWQVEELWDSVFLTLTDITELLKYVQHTARHPFIYPLFVFAVHTGARRSEIIRSQIDDIDFVAKTVVIREKKRIRGKLSTRRVPMSPLLGTVLTKWFKQHPGGSHTFCKPQELLRSKKKFAALSLFTVHELHHFFKVTLAGSKWEKLRGWHVFRHSFCSNCAAVGIDQRHINDWVGHQTEEMVRRYRHLVPDQQQTAIRSVFGD